MKERINQQAETGPFDIIGDVHGCFEEFQELLRKLGYLLEKAPDDRKYFGIDVTPPPGRKLVLVGDLVDRGPDTPSVLRLVMSMVLHKKAFCVMGNHDNKLLRKLSGRNVQITHGLAESLEQLSRERNSFIESVRTFLGNLPSHLVLDGGKLVIAHAGLREDLHSKDNKTVRALAMYGPTTGELDELGLPVRLNWVIDYTGQAKVVYGHTPVAAPEWKQNTIDIDTGCVFGGKLTALRWPENELVFVKAKKVYATAGRPFLPEHFTAWPEKNTPKTT